MTVSDLPAQIELIRHFNRFYTRQIGVLEEGLLSSPYSLTEARIIYELAHHEQATATELASCRPTLSQTDRQACGFRVN